MTGKNALDVIKYGIPSAFQEEYLAIKKDLEMLDLLKNLIMVNYKVEFYNNDITGTPIGLGIKNKPSAEELQEIERWLHNERTF